MFKPDSDIEFYQEGARVTVWPITQNGGAFLHVRFQASILALSAESSRAYETDLAHAILMIDDALNAGLTVGSNDADPVEVQ